MKGYYVYCFTTSSSTSTATSATTITTTGATTFFTITTIATTATNRTNTTVDAQALPRVLDQLYCGPSDLLCMLQIQKVMYIET